MKKNSSNKNIKFPRYNILLSLVLLIASSCNPTKYVPQNETLLDKNNIFISNDRIKKSALIPYIRQKPNKRIFGTRFHLGLYNLSNINKQKWPHSWLREIGEEPVIFDPYSAEKSKEQIQSYIASKGYFDSRVSDTIETVNRKTRVDYKIDLKTPYKIKNVFFEIADTLIKKIFNFNSLDCLIKKGEPYDEDVLRAERTRFERIVKDLGFYNFSGDHIYFNVDSTIGNREVNIYYGVKNFMKIDENKRTTTVPHSIYSLRNIYIFPDFVPKEALEEGDAYIKSLDTVNYNGYFFIAPRGKPGIKYDIILQSLYLKPGAKYSLTFTAQSQSHLLSLKTFRLVNIFYNELPDQIRDKESNLMLDCVIQLTPLSQQSFRVELEGTHTDGDLGGALNLIYQHNNLFHGAELFNMKLVGAYEVIRHSRDTSMANTLQLRSIQEFGIETSLMFPKFLVPFIRSEEFRRKYNPTTTVLTAFNYQKIPLYTRTIANATFGYNWHAGDFVTHVVNPVQLNYVYLPKDKIDPAFQARIDTTPSLAYSYRSVMILGGNYSYIFNNQTLKRSKDYWFLRINAETSGNILRILGNLTGTKDSTGSFNIFRQPFAQYLRTDFDFRYNISLNNVSSMVFRGFIGAGIPFGNSKTMPFEKQYFGGGANGIRAWQVRSLGPGSYKQPLDNLTIPFQTADIKLEGNIEYRFNLFWILKGALFLDAGNIWVYKDYNNSRPGSVFNKNFYNEIAVGTGFGFRFDLGFVLLRADIGIKLRDPSLDKGSRWITNWQDYYKATTYVDKNMKERHANISQLVVGIGYPF